MSQVYCFGAIPPALDTAAFDPSLKSRSTLFVSEAAIATYSSSSWNFYFKEITKFSNSNDNKVPSLFLARKVVEPLFCRTVSPASVNLCLLI